MHRIFPVATIVCTVLAVACLAASGMARASSPTLWEYAKLQSMSEVDFLSTAYAYNGGSGQQGGIIDARLPGPTHLTVRGRKTISLKFTYYDYLNAEDTEGKPQSTTEVEQRLQVQARGEIGRKIKVNVDYDDSAPPAEQQQISLRYRGDPHELIQEVALGDIQLSLPRSYFVSYNKSLFGARLQARWSDFYLTAIGAVTRGVSEEKTFTGKTTTEEREIADTSYVRRKYFKPFYDQAYPPSKFGHPAFSYEEGSVEVWVDDQDGTNNDDAVLLTVVGNPTGSATNTYTGYFDRQYAGQDYTVDYPAGVLKLNQTAGEQDVIAVSYVDGGGTRHPDSGYYMIMRGPDENYLVYRFLDYYSLGTQRIEQDEFVFQIKDLSDNIVFDWDDPAQYPAYEVGIDFDFGIVQITSSASAGVYYRPFPQAYPPDSLHRYTLHTEYVHAVDLYLLHPDIVPGSEQVYVDGELQERDEDYVIDYASGYLSFLDSDKIQSDTEIRVQYEWMPIMGGQATVVGGRLEYRPSDVFSLGTTLLTQTASPVGSIPSVGSTPAAHQIWEVDASLDLETNLGSLWGGDLPTSLSLLGELSQSQINPNTFGAALVEGFAGTKAQSDLPLAEASWKLGSRPAPVDPSARDTVTISDEEVAGDSVNPAWSDDDITVLSLSYDFTAGMSWDSVVHALSPVGYDYSHMKYLEVWTQELTPGMSVYLDLGVASEDADGDGQLDTEDANGDGVLNPGEDTGIVMNLPTGAITIGTGNSKLDTEDLDGDGLLDTTESVATYGLLEEYKTSLGTGWSKYTIPLEDYLPLGQDWNAVKTLVKQVRVWATGAGITPTLRIARIRISGDRWEVSNLGVKVVDNYDDTSFPNPFDSAAFVDYYQRMFGDPETTGGKWQRESAVRLSGDTGYIQQTFTAARSFADYGQMGLWLYHEDAAGSFQLRFGADVEANYYQYEVPLSAGTAGQWYEVSIPFDELSVVGAPSFGEIKQIRFAIEDMLGSEPLYLDDVYLSEVRSERGQAQRYLLRTSFDRYLTVTGEYQRVDPPFSVIGSSTRDEKKELKKLNLTSNALPYLPMSYGRSEQYTSTVYTEGTDLTLREKNRVQKNVQSYSVGLRLPRWPTLGFTGSNSISKKLSASPEEREAVDDYKLSLDYAVPSRSSFLPTRISGSLQLIDKRKEVEATSTTGEVTRKGSVTLPFQPAHNVSLKTSYSQSHTNETDDGGPEYPKSRSKNASVNLRASVFRLRPEFAFTAAGKEEEFSSDHARRKVSGDFSASCTLPLRPGAFAELPPSLSNIGWYFTYKLDREGIYEDTSASPDLASQFGLHRLQLPDGTEKLWREKTTFTAKQTWRPMPYLNTSLSYSREQENKTESGTPFSVAVDSWPVLQCKLDLNRAPLVGPWFAGGMSSSDLVLEFSRKHTDKAEISTTTVWKPELSWRGIWRRPSTVALTYSYSGNRSKELAHGATSTKDQFSSKHSLKVEWSARAPWQVEVPAVGASVGLKNEITLSTLLSKEHSFKVGSAGTIEKDEEKWTLGTDIAYNLTDYIRTKFGLDIQYFQDRVTAGKDYISYAGSVWAEIRF